MFSIAQRILKSKIPKKKKEREQEQEPNYAIQNRPTIVEKDMSLTSSERTIYSAAFTQFFREKREALDFYQAVQNNQAFQKVTKGGAIQD